MIRAGVCLSYLEEIPRGIHSDQDIYKIALFEADADLDENIKSYLDANSEIPARGGYARGGQELIGFNTLRDGRTIVVGWGTNPKWDPSTITARAAMIYNSTLPNKNAVLILDLGKNISSTNGPFELVQPPMTAEEGLIRIGTDAG